MTVPRSLIIPIVLITILGCKKDPACGDDECAGDEDAYSCPHDCNLKDMQTVMEKGGRVDWDKSGSGLIAYDKKRGDGYYDIYTMKPDGSDKKCITCGAPGVPQKHNGNPAWHPNGEWIIFQAEKGSHQGNSYNSTPGKGVRCDLWMVKKDGSEAHKVYSLNDSPNNGVLHPHFSEDGKKLTFVRMYKAASGTGKKSFGSWRIMVADYTDTSGTPSLTNINSYQPGDEVFYETHSFTSNGESILFSSNMNSGKSPLRANNLYFLDLSSGNTSKLTDGDYNEHATISPKMEMILFGSNRDNSQGMDYWFMDQSGGQRSRLTHFNKKGAAENEGFRNKWAVDHSWSPDGKRVICYVQDDLVEQTGSIWMLSFKKPM